MKFLIDENLPARLEGLLSDLFPDSVHVKRVGLIEADDRAVWSFARTHGHCILTEDKDFQQMSVLLGHPPKVVWLRCGNASTARLAELMLDMAPGIFHFHEHEHRSLLILAAPGS